MDLHQETRHIVGSTESRCRVYVQRGSVRQEILGQGSIATIDSAVQGTPWAHVPIAASVRIDAQLDQALHHLGAVPKQTKVSGVAPKLR